jgi:heme/copper-type cytochrome/quinol oxidase subunit 2
VYINSNIKLRVGNLNCNVVGFDDAYSILFLIPICVCLLVIIGLGWDNKNNISGDLYVNFETVWLSLPIMVFLSLGLGSIGIRSLMLEEDNDMEIALSANQWHWGSSVIFNINREIQEYIICGVGGTSTDVLHSYSIIDYDIHTDCIPGKKILHTLLVNVIYDVYITCQELCGYGHSGISLQIFL